MGHTLFHWELSSAWMVNVTDITETEQNRELGNIMKSIKLWKSGTSDHFVPRTNKQQKPLSIRISVGISLSLQSFHRSVFPKIQSFSQSLFQFILQEVDITLPENSVWYERYKFDIPVFHLNGQFLMMHRVNISKLEKQLQKLEQQGAGG